MGSCYRLVLTGTTLGQHRWVPHGKVHDQHCTGGQVLSGDVAFLFELFLLLRFELLSGLNFFWAGFGIRRLLALLPSSLFLGPLATVRGFMLHARCGPFRNMCIVALCGLHITLQSNLSFAGTVAFLYGCRWTCRFRGRIGFSADDDLKSSVAAVLRLIVKLLCVTLAGLELCEDGSPFGFGQPSKRLRGDS